MSKCKNMNHRKIAHQEWIIDLGCDPETYLCPDPEFNASEPNPIIIKAVNDALAKLSDIEQDFIRRYYFECESCQSIAEMTGRTIKSILRLRYRSVKKMKKHLAFFVQNQFGLKIEHNQNCPLCNSPDIRQINEMFEAKKKEETWRKIFKSLKTDFEITIKTANILISHQKYHIN